MLSCEPINIFFVLVRSWYFWAIVAVLGWVAFKRWERHPLHLTDFETPVPNRYYTTSFRYYFAGVFYALIIVSAYVLITVFLSIDQIVEFIYQMFGNVIGASGLALDERGLCLGQFLYPTVDQIASGVFSDELRQLDPLAASGAAAGEPLTPLNERVRNILLFSFTILVVASSSPYIGPYDSKLRERLLEFAAIPTEARRLANQIIAGVDFPEHIRERFQEFPDDYIENRWSDPRTFHAVMELIEAFEEERGDDYPDYREFFTEMRFNLAPLVDQEEILTTNIELSDRSQRLYNKEMATLNRKAALLLALGVLKNENDEAAAAYRLRSWGIETADIPSFRFSVGQVIIGLLMALLLSTGGQAVVAAGLFLGGFGAETGSLAAALTAGFNVGIAWAAVTAGYFVIPMVLAAGVQLYLFDRRAGVRSRGVRRIDGPAGGGFFANASGYLIMLFVFSYLAGFIIILLYLANAPEGVMATGNAPPLANIAPYPLTAGLFAVAFCLMTSSNFTKSLTLNLLLDFVVFFVVTFTSTYFATVQVFGLNPEGMLATAQSFEGVLSAEGKQYWTLYGLASSTGLIAAFLGTAMSLLSRRRSIAYLQIEDEEDERVEGLVSVSHRG